MKVTRAEIHALIKFGDGIGVTYRKADGIAQALRAVEGGRTSHWIECHGGFDTFEETIGGGMRTNLATYLRGNCDLTIRRAPRKMTEAGTKRIRDYWVSLEGKGYGFDSIKRSLITVPVRRFVKPHHPTIARGLIWGARLLLPGQMPDCSAAWVDGIRLDQPILAGYDACEVDPQQLVNDPHLITVARWPAPVLVD